METQDIPDDEPVAKSRKLTDFGFRLKADVVMNDMNLETSSSRIVGRDVDQKKNARHAGANIPNSIGSESKDWLLYEHYAISHHAKIYEGQTWHWTVVPEEALVECGWLCDHMEHLKLKTTLGASEAIKKYREYGLDGLHRTDEGLFVGLQMKTSTLVHTNMLGSFQMAIALMRMKNSRNQGHLYYTQGLEWNESLYKHVYGISATKLPFLSAEEHVVRLCEDQHDQSTPFELHSWQSSAIDAIGEWYVSSQKNGILAAPPGTGKTMAFIRAAFDLKVECIVLLSPTIALAEQNSRACMRHMPGYKVILFNSSTHATRDLVDLPLNGNVVVSSTFHSCDLLNIWEREPDLLILDEAHLIDQNKEASNYARQTTAHVLYVSGTPNEIVEEDDACIVYQFPLRTAISQGYICDYRVLLPISLTPGVELPIDDPTFYHRAAYMVAATERFGLRAIIVFLQKKSDIPDFKQKLANELKIHNRPLWTGNVLAETKKREQILKRFARSENPGELRVLFAIRILDYGIDVPECDTVFFTQAPCQVGEYSAARAVQRLCRAVRLDSARPSKVATALVWADRESFPELFISLKAEDPCYHSRIRMVASCYLNQHHNQEIELTEKVKEEVFVEIGLREISSWEQNYQKLCEFHKEHGHCNVPQRNPLGSWVSNQRQDMKKNMPPERIAKLEALGFVLDLSKAVWEENYQKLCDFQKEHGHCNVHRKDPLGTWVHTQRTCMKNNKMLPERVTKLQELGIVFVTLEAANPTDTINRFCELYSQKPPSHVDELAVWWNNVYRNFTGANGGRRLSDEHVRDLKKRCTWIEEWAESVKDPSRKHQTNVDWFIQMYSSRAPQHKEELAEWWSSVQGNFSDKKQNIHLSEPQIKAMKERCTWIEEWEECLEDPFRKHQANVDRFIQLYSNNAPQQKGELGKWWCSARSNFSENKPNLHLSEQQIEEIRERCAWIEEWEKCLKEPSRKHQTNVDRFIQLYFERPPRDKEEMCIWWESIQNNFVEGKSAKTHLCEMQISKIRRECDWVVNWQEYQVDPTSRHQKKVDEFVQRYIDQPPKINEPLYTFWGQIINNFLERECSNTKLSPTQVAFVRDNCTWVKRRIEDIEDRFQKHQARVEMFVKFHANIAPTNKDEMQPWWVCIQSNFVQKKRMDITLSQRQNEYLLTECLWLTQWITKFNSPWVVQESRVNRFIRAFSKSPPAFKAVIGHDGWKVGIWWNSVRGNFVSGRKKGNTKLCPEQKERMFVNCGWIHQLQPGNNVAPSVWKSFL